MFHEDKFIPEPNSGCWLWTGVIQERGYGQVRHKGKTHRAHRVFFERFCEPIPDGLRVLHRCDVRSCVNPDHLFLGTNADNTADMIKKGRSFHRRGEEAGGAKITENDVLAIRADGRPHREIAKDYGLGKTTIGYIKSRINWKHLP